MYHTIQFAVQFTADRETSAKHPLERILIRPGTCMRAEVRPYVEEATGGPVAACRQPTGRASGGRTPQSMSWSVSSPGVLS